MDIKMRIRLDQYQTLRHLLIHDTSVEQGCFLLCSETRTDDSIIILANEIIPLTSSDYARQRPDFLSIKPETMLRVARLAKAKDKSICFIHTHPMSSGAVDFSLADDNGNLRTFDFFNRMLPDRLNSALVFDKNLAVVSGRTYTTHRDWANITSVTVPGYPYLVSINKTSAPSHSPETFNRHALLLGELGQECLSNIKAVFVGMGGIGSLASLFAAHSGFKHITLIDPDYLEESNRPRIAASTPAQVTNETRKVDISAQYIKQCWPDCDVHTISLSAEEGRVINSLIEADVIICGTDNAHSRAYLNEVCQRYYVPLLDMGVEFTSSKNKLSNEVGKVNLVIPGTACLWCTEHVTSKLLADEELPPEEIKKRADEGYVRNIYLPQPSMMAYNGEVVARGIQHIIQHFTGLLPSDISTYEQFSFLGLNNRNHHRTVKKRQQQSCPFCNTHGDVLGEGSASELLIKPAA